MDIKNLLVLGLLAGAFAKTLGGAIPTQDDQKTPVDCAVGDWQMVGPCMSILGNFRQKMTRKILVQPMNGGKTCPAVMEKFEECTNRIGGDDNGKQGHHGERDDFYVLKETITTEDGAIKYDTRTERKKKKKGCNTTDSCQSDETDGDAKATTDGETNNEATDDEKEDKAMTATMDATFEDSTEVKSRRRRSRSRSRSKSRSRSRKRSSSRSSSSDSSSDSSSSDSDGGGYYYHGTPSYRRPSTYSYTRRYRHNGYGHSHGHGHGYNHGYSGYKGGSSGYTGYKGGSYGTSKYRYSTRRYRPSYRHHGGSHRGRGGSSGSGSGSD